MSINPATDVTYAIDTQLPGKQMRAGESAPLQRPPAPVLGVRPQRDFPDGSSEPISAETPVDEVQVQQTSGRIVIRYLDHSGDLILQVPSSQVLGLARAIEEALEQQTKSRGENSPEPVKGGTADGH
jgi:hypothetical protein